MSNKQYRNLSRILIVTSFFLFAMASFLRIEHQYKTEGLEVISDDNK